MKKTIAALLGVEFMSAGGDVEVWTFRDGGQATGPGGVSGRYRWDDDGRRLCTFVGEARVCRTFTRITPASGVGESSPYTTTEGERGTAVVTAKSS